jgi:protein TonB
MSSAALPLSAFPGPLPFQRPPRRRSGLLVIAAAHAAAIWLFLQADVVVHAVQQATPLMVALLSDPAPVRPPEPLPVPQPQRQALPPPTLMPPPEVRVADAAPPAPPPAPVIASVVPAPAVPAVVAPAEPAPVRALPAPPPAVTAPPVLPASAIRYRVAPPVEVPLASRRLRESGTVLLRVLVDAQGLPKQITLHKSSGFARLDEQAQAAMRQARFQVVNDNGQAIEWLVIAPLQYDVD